MDRYRNRQETTFRPGPAVRSASPTRSTFVRSNTPSPEDTMAARLRAENARWPLIDDDDGAAPQAPSTPSRSAGPTSTSDTPQSATTSSTYGTPSSTAASPLAGGTRNRVIAQFDARQKNLILYLALRGISKAAIVSILRSEAQLSQAKGYNAERWERVAAPMVKAELEALVETVGEGQDWTHDTAAIVGRVLTSAEAGEWNNTILVRAADYMIIARPGMNRGAIKKELAEMARERIKEKKKAIAGEMQQLVRAADIQSGSVARLQPLADSFGTGSRRQRLDGSYDFLAPEEDMLGILVELQDDAVLCGQQLFSW